MKLWDKYMEHFRKRGDAWNMRFMLIMVGLLVLLLTVNLWTASDAKAYCDTAKEVCQNYTPNVVYTLSCKDLAELTCNCPQPAKEMQMRYFPTVTTLETQYEPVPKPA